MVQIAVLGCGVVGRGVVDFLVRSGDVITAKVGEPIEVKYILERRELPDCPYADKFVRDFSVILSDPEVALVVEAMGGSHPAYDFSKDALKAGKHVVTSNKEVVANFGEELLKVAEEAGVQYLFEASVGGGIPVLRPLATDLSAHAIEAVSGILNGTTNYILTRMFDAGVSFEEALTEAKEKGYAEANPAADIEGLDACRKIAILAAIVTGKLARTDAIHTEGITGVRAADVAAAARCGCKVKLLGRMVTNAGECYLMVAPFLVPQACPLAGIRDVYNGILVHSPATDDILFYGKGAGALPTAGAIVSDILHIASGGVREHRNWQLAGEEDVTDFAYFVCRRYLALEGVDPAAAAVIFGSAEIIEGEETALITADMSEKEYSDRLQRLAASGGRVLSHIRLYA